VNMIPRKKVHKEGQLKQIGDLFIAALLHHRRPDESTIHFMERLFNVDTRYIFQCAVTASFTLGDCLFTPGMRLVVRHDTTNADLFEVADLKESDTVHQVARAQWCVVRGFLRVVDKNKDGEQKVFGDVRA
jgi:hypothetical protein